MSCGCRLLEHVACATLLFSQAFVIQALDSAVLSSRSPAVASRELVYGQRLAAWIGASAFARVLLLSSLPAELRKDQQLSSGELQPSACVCGDGAEDVRTKLQTLGWKCVSFTAGTPISGNLKLM